MRAPLAFLLGKLNFAREFRSFELRPEGDATWIVAQPKSENLAYTKVEFLATAAGEIRQVRVTGQDQSRLDFTFANQVMNPPVPAGKFVFQPPAGAEIVTRTEPASNRMSEFVLKYADTRGEVREQTATGVTEQEVRERYVKQGFLVYSVKPKSGLVAHRRYRLRRQEAEPRKVPDLQPAVRDADSRRAADS